jgi:hypothetical protein
VPRRDIQCLVFSYHKTGTSLFLGVMSKISQVLDLRFANLYGPVRRIPTQPDFVLLPHSLLFGPLNQPCRGIRLVRDPRDIWVSGYLYHRHSREPWCRNSNLDPTSPILLPKVDYAMLHWPEAAKAAYLERLGGKSYQQNLLDRSQPDGLEFELQGYTAATLAAMESWPLNTPDILDVKLESVMVNFDATMLVIFQHFCFTAEECQAALAVARTEDVHRMDDAAVAARPQIHSRAISKWQTTLSADQIERFEARYRGLIERLGYQRAT